MNKSRKIIISVTIIVILVGIVSYTFYKRTHQHRLYQPQAINVKVHTPQTKTIADQVNAVGTLVAAQQTFITPKVDGYITKINFHEGQFVKAGTVLIQLDDSKERAQLDSDMANLKLSQLNYERSKKLIATHAISISELDIARNGYQVKKAAVDASRNALDNKTLNAPFSGYFGARNISVGDYVSASQQLVSLIDRNNLLVEYNLPGNYAELVKPQQIVTVISNNKTHAKAQVSYVSPEIDPKTRTINIHATLNNKNNQFTPGEFVQIKQHIGEKQKVLFVPEQTIQSSIAGNSVFVVKNNHAQSVPVKIGRDIHGYVEILSGLNANDQVITEGENKVRDGSLVRVLP